MMKLFIFVLALSCECCIAGIADERGREFFIFFSKRIQFIYYILGKLILKITAYHLLSIHNNARSECCSDLMVKDTGYFGSLQFTKMEEKHYGKPKWCSTKPYETCLEFTPGK